MNEPEIPITATAFSLGFGCGSGTFKDGEECDGGLGCVNCTCSGKYKPYAYDTYDISIRKDCELMCGNGILDFGEECDSAPNCNLFQCTCDAGFKKHEVIPTQCQPLQPYPLIIS